MNKWNAMLSASLLWSALAHNYSAELKQENDQHANIIKQLK